MKLSGKWIIQNCTYIYGIIIIIVIICDLDDKQVRDDEFIIHYVIIILFLKNKIIKRVMSCRMLN